LPRNDHRTPATSQFRQTLLVDDPRLERWLAALLATPGLTSIDDPAEARRMLLEDALLAVDVVRGLEGPIVDVGSGGGSPGIPLAAALPDREVALLEARRRKCDFLREVAGEFPNVSVIEGRAEEQETDRFGVALAKALAKPPVAVEWCLPLVRPGGAAILWVGPSADLAAVGRVSEQVGGAAPELEEGLAVVRKVSPTPEGFPRRPGMARKRPLA
jgi:16S rRNA (guanine527-N7)-methyltransferase